MDYRFLLACARALGSTLLSVASVIAAYRNQNRRY
jgi:hypothetical protein